VNSPVSGSAVAASSSSAVWAARRRLTIAFTVQFQNMNVMGKAIK
jgi:hypothetical protein